MESKNTLTKHVVQVYRLCESSLSLPAENGHLLIEKWVKGEKKWVDVWVSSILFNCTSKVPIR